jgi:hypothetical protein
MYHMRSGILWYALSFHYRLTEKVASLAYAEWIRHTQGDCPLPAKMLSPWTYQVHHFRHKSLLPIKVFRLHNVVQNQYYNLSLISLWQIYIQNIPLSRLFLLISMPMFIFLYMSKKSPVKKLLEKDKKEMK